MIKYFHVLEDFRKVLRILTFFRCET